MITTVLVTVLQQELQSKKDILNGWLSHHPLKTADEFFDYAVKKIVQPGIDKYKKLFEADTCDHYHLKKAMYAARLFNPFFIDDSSEQVLCMLIDELHHFGPGFDFVFRNQFFLQNMKGEVKKLKHLASLDYDWEADSGSE